jgi:YidC/Oxa1 family membrane protein insertase
MSDFLGPVITVAYHVISAVVGLFTPLAGGLAPALAIVAFTVAVRLLLEPLSYIALRAQARQARLLPQVRDLQRRYAKQPERLQRELVDLQRREGALLAGCLPLLAQLPFLSVTYALVRSATVDGHVNRLLGGDLFGASLGGHWLSGAGPVSAQGLVFLGLFALIAVGGWVTTRVTRAAGLAGGAAAAVPAAPGQAQPAALGLLTKVMPYASIVIAAIMPLAAGLYLLTTTACTAAERAVLGRRLAVPAAPGGREGVAVRSGGGSRSRR